MDRELHHCITKVNTDFASRVINKGRNKASGSGLQSGISPGFFGNDIFSYDLFYGYILASNKRNFFVYVERNCALELVLLMH